MSPHEPSYGSVPKAEGDLENHVCAVRATDAPKIERSRLSIIVAVGFVALSVMAVTKAFIVGGGIERGNTALRGVGGSAHDVKLDKVVCGTNELMRLACEVRFGVHQDALGQITEVFLHHVPTADPGYHAYSSAKLDNADGTDDSYAYFKTELYRFRPSTEYRVGLCDVDGRVVDDRVVVSASSGIDSDLDAGGTLATVEGRTTYELMSFAWVKGFFRGIIAIDKGGYPVWYLNITSASASVECDDDSCGPTTLAHPEAFAQIQKGELKGAYCVTQMHPGANSTKSGALVMRPDGQKVARLQKEALKADPEAVEISIQGHECRPTDEGNLLLSGYETHRLTSSKLGGGYGETVIEGFTIGLVAREFFMEWNPLTNVIEKNVFVNDVEPFQEVVKLLATQTAAVRTFTPDITDDPSTDDDGFLIEYMHISAISVSWDGKYYIVSMRDANGVFALHRTSLELAWMLGGELPNSSFEFKNPTADRFTYPHDAKLYAPHEDYPDSLGTLCLMDDGGSDALCNTDDETSGCSSRALCYVLDAVAGTATRLFAFSYPNNEMDGALTRHESAQNLLNLNGGVISEFNGGYFIAFTSVYKAPFDDYSWAFEVSKSGKINSITKLPHVDEWATASGGTSGIYRAEVMSTIYGESSKLENVGNFENVGM